MSMHLFSFFFSQFRWFMFITLLSCLDFEIPANRAVSVSCGFVVPEYVLRSCYLHAPHNNVLNEFFNTFTDPALRVSSIFDGTIDGAWPDTDLVPQ